MAVWRFQPRITSENATGANLGDLEAIFGDGLPTPRTKKARRLTGGLVVGFDSGLGLPKAPGWPTAQCLFQIPLRYHCP